MCGVKGLNQVAGGGTRSTLTIHSIRGITRTLARIEHQIRAPSLSRFALPPLPTLMVIVKVISGPLILNSAQKEISLIFETFFFSLKKFESKIHLFI